MPFACKYHGIPFYILYNVEWSAMFYALKLSTICSEDTDKQDWNFQTYIRLSFICFCFLCFDGQKLNCISWKFTKFENALLCTGSIWLYTWLQFFSLCIHTIELQNSREKKNYIYLYHFFNVSTECDFHRINPSMHSFTWQEKLSFDRLFRQC